MQRTILNTAMAAVMLAATTTGALAETTILRGTPPRDTAAAAQRGNQDIANGISGGGAPDESGPIFDQSGTRNALSTGSANAGGEIRDLPAGLRPQPAPAGRQR